MNNKIKQTVYSSTVKKNFIGLLGGMHPGIPPLDPPLKLTHVNQTALKHMSQLILPMIKLRMPSKYLKNHILIRMLRIQIRSDHKVNKIINVRSPTLNFLSALKKMDTEESRTRALWIITPRV